MELFLDVLNRYKPNKVVVALSLCFSAINIACIIVEWFSGISPFLEYITLFYGVFIGWFSVSILLAATKVLPSFGSKQSPLGPRHL